MRSEVRDDAAMRDSFTAGPPQGETAPSGGSAAHKVASVGAYIALAGPTASGKTAAALAIARQHDCEIISVDSALVYRGMDIGSAKPCAAELAAVPHHLINIRDPLQAYSAAEFVTDAKNLIADITARGKLALLVGGTMLYFKALRDGLDAMPKADPAIRAALEQEARQQGWPALHAALARVDPATAARLHPADAQRIARALEVFRLTGQPLSSFQRTRQAMPETCAKTDPNWLIALEPSQRSWLHERIAQRFDSMLANGFLDEVKVLRARGDLHADLPAMRCVGYRQAWQALAEQWPVSELRDKGIFATRQLAKRQLTWLRAMPERRVVVCDAPDALAQALRLVQAFVEGRS
ncbi:MAG: tRNA (adenosine(37)-N6)-dimethylallyltransferase MiaA [Rhodoferax sp.]|uniref:tRNA (adenosine(37)-N6)-dimethylallyltransferase MiaA n=1 Tax=Rhodoferax sp. TaxID=50421 RepID=UPI00262C2346|nr:tRNA (adenosine(37)-N6)-dimethylallyltransferase MiaA [Rhodoferax sp.]MDD5335664.1 tRNA (adenosine(37)-N6)-dimethylallyltransferase MiaA [Rhodoferax sp.]